MPRGLVPRFFSACAAPPRKEKSAAKRYKSLQSGRQMESQLHTDEKWMREALLLARRAAGRTSPNPMVGAVVVSGGRKIAEGWHEGPGLPHAERFALDRAGGEARGATLYVTLEPCSHYGRTPPCVDRIVEAGVARVVAAMRDPDPRVDGEGLRRLEERGIEVVTGVLEREALLLNRGFLTRTLTGRPYVYLKVAQSLDGRVATRLGESQWITSVEARQDGHLLRAEVDAILVGIGTVLADDPLLTARPEGSAPVRQPLRVVVDSRARTPLHARCLDSEAGPVLLATTTLAPAEKLSALEKKGVDVWVAPPKAGRVDLEALTQALGARGLNHILVEGGPALAGAFFDADLVDEVRAYVSPLLIGGEGALSSVGGLGRGRLREAARLVDSRWEQVGPDLRFAGRVPRPFLLDPSRIE